jgi:hypothetical protein
VETNEKGAKKSGRSRYWSVMLVGDHGRVIPFRHFKALIVGVGVVLTLSFCALILMGVLYTRQSGQNGHLREQLEQLHTQSTKLRDEKDICLTQLIALKNQAGVLAQKPAESPPAADEANPPVDAKAAEPASAKAVSEPDESAPAVQEAKKELPEKKVEPAVQWSADIRNFNVAYDNRQGALTAEFKIINTSRPKKRLNGRTVVVFKTIGDSPGQWAVVPAVPLEKETPVGKEGRSFSIRNFQTERFKTLRRNNSPKYDIAAVYIFVEEDGVLIANKEMPFNVDYSPPAPPKPVVARPKEEPVKPTSPLKVPQEQNTSIGQSQPGESVAPDAAPGEAAPSVATPPSDSPSGPPTPEIPADQGQPKPQIEPEGGAVPDPGASDAIPQSPATEPQPAQEGETQ